MNHKFYLYRTEVERRVQKAMKIKTLNLNFSESEIVERAMRCGIEARYFAAENEQEIHAIAMLSLKLDRAR